MKSAETGGKSAAARKKSAIIDGKGKNQQEKGKISEDKEN